MKNNLNHGNRLRHPIDAYEKKKERARKHYADVQMKLNPTWRNERIIRDEVNLNDNNCIIHPDELIKMEFCFDVYSRCLMKGDEKVYVMKKYGYSITKSKMIKLWKL